MTPAIRSAIELRYRLLPYFYTLLWQAHADDEPMLRPTFLDHEHDTQTFEECDDFLLGRDILVASVVEEGQRKRRVWLPANETGWYDFYTHEWFCGGQWIVRDAPLENCHCWSAPAQDCRSARESGMLARRRMIPVS